MNRPGHEEAKFFFGTEVEHTPAHGMDTLFVIGVQSIKDIQSKLSVANEQIKHIFFGANHSFDPQSRYDHELLGKQIYAMMG